MWYHLPFSNQASGAVADTYLTVASLIAAATTGHRARLRRLFIGPATDTPADAELNIQVKRIADVSAGTAGTLTAVTAAAMPRPESRQLDGIITGGLGYTVEPTAYEAKPVWQAAMNMRGGISYEWSELDAPTIDNDQLLGLLVAPTLAAAQSVSGYLSYQEF